MKEVKSKIKITPKGITYSFYGEAKEAEKIGLLMGKAMVFEQIERELLIAKLLTPEVKEVIYRLRSKLL